VEEPLRIFIESLLQTVVLTERIGSKRRADGAMDRAITDGGAMRKYAGILLTVAVAAGCTGIASKVDTTPTHDLPNLYRSVSPSGNLTLNVADGQVPAGQKDPLKPLK
jgi:hypothetical protein